MATLPTRLVEVEFDTGVWTDVAADVVSVATRRGRNRESGAFETGTMTITLRNDGRKYDPDNTAGPYYGKLRPNRRVRFRATYNAVTYPVFQGYIDRIAQVYGGPNDATAEIQVSDLFKILNRVELPTSVYRAEVADNATADMMWWPLDEPAGSAHVADIGSRKALGVVRPGTTLGAAGLVVRDPGAAMTVAGGGQGFVVERVTNPDAALSGTGPFAVAGWVQAGTQTDPTYGTLFAQSSTVPGNLLFVHVAIQGSGFGADAGKIRFRIGLTSIVLSTVSVADNSVHHWAVERTAAGALKIYVDGVDRTASAVTDTNNIPVGNMAFGHYPDGGWDLVGTLQHVAIWPTSAPGAAVWADLNTAGRTPWNGDLPGTRLVRVFTLAGVGDYTLDTGVQTLQATNLGGTVLDYAQKVEETDAGRLFVTADGDVRFLDRLTADTGAYLTAQTTLVDDDSGAGRPYRFVSADVDEATVVTRATVSREGSVTRTYDDTAAQAEYRIVAETHEGLLHNSDDYSMAYAQWIVNTHRTPATRVGTIELELPKDPATMYPDLLGLELAERVTYKRKPQNTGAVFTQDMRVEAIEHSTGSHYWTTRLYLTPFNLGQGGYGTGVWDTSLWDQATWGL